VVLACRQETRGEQAVAELRARVPAEEAARWDYDVLPLDLASPSSVRAFENKLRTRLELRARAHRAKPTSSADSGIGGEGGDAGDARAPLSTTAHTDLHTGLDILVLNAGIFHAPFEITEFGVESQFAVNHVANQMLASLLLPLLDRAVETSGVATVTVVTSATIHAADSVSLTVQEVNDEARFYSPMWYARSKLAGALFTRKLARNWKVTCACVWGGRG
jgi:NAD(P)-dependent dehydrogenase (short-subunit alcohol dehydrogenase family)